MDDQEHDQNLKEGDQEDRRFKDCRTTCQAKGWHDYNAAHNPPSPTFCRTCVKRDGISAETEALMRLHWLLEGGMPMDRDELSYDAWYCRGLLRKRLNPGLF